ncbi:MFS transporter [Pseudochelatococcus contaminans]|uniref:Benzoate transport n=1 Tax=Pseudochelatococcus contaminans TaxID=1538103 RepID=A0A7W5Z5C5_9HYPH|nr:MFS transporter [Pseudochelatococcus contaminans]MBB3810402.1 benzoate transport [Pseudochelatococcus contaminans]
MNMIDTLKQGPMRLPQIGIVMLCIVIAMVDGYEVVAMPFSMSAIARDWQLPNSQVGYLLSAGIAGMALGALFLAPLADRVGRRQHILACLGAITVTMVLSGLAQGLWQLVIIRLIAGLFIGALVPSLNVIVSEYCSDKRRGLVMGLYGIGLPLGSALAGYAISPLIDAYGWRATFLFGGVLSFAVMLFALVLLPESIDYLVHKRPADALTRYNRIARRLGFAGASKLPEPSTDRTGQRRLADLFRGELLPRTLLLWVGFACLSASFYFANTWTAKIMADMTGDQHLGIQVAMLIQYGGVAGALIFGLLTLWLHPRTATALLIGLGGIAFYLYAVNVTNVSVAMVIAVAVGMCANGGLAAYFAISPSIYPTMLRGTGVGLMIGVGRGFAILGPIVTGFILAGSWTPVDVYKLFAGAMVVSAIATVGLILTFREKEPVVSNA